MAVRHFFDTFLHRMFYSRVACGPSRRSSDLPAPLCGKYTTTSHPTCLGMNSFSI
jgi:hypothetical protein